MLQAIKFEEVGGWATVIAVVLFVLSCAYAYFLYRRSQVTKTIDWIPHSVTSIVRQPVDTVATGLRLLWGETVLRTPFTIEVRIKNTGRLPVLDSEYLTPMTIDFGSATCYDARVVKRSAPDVIALGSLIRDPSSTFTLATPTLNKGDWFDVVMVADGEAR